MNTPFSLLLRLLLLLILSTPALAGGNEIRLVNNRLVRLRIRPDAGSSSRGIALLGDPLVVLNRRGNWLHVRPGYSMEPDAGGWVRSDSTAAAVRPASHLTNRVVLQNTGNTALIPLYRAEGKRYKAVAFAYDGTTLPLLAVSNGNSYLLLPDGKPAMANTVQTTPLAAARFSVQTFYRALQKCAADTALQGEKPSTGELIAIAARSCGALTGTDSNRLLRQSRPVTVPAQVEPGDLVFFREKNPGIVAPGANFIYSRNGQPGFRSLYTAGWKEQITGYRRLQPAAIRTGWEELRKPPAALWTVLRYRCRQRSSLLPLLRKPGYSGHPVLIGRLKDGSWGIFSGLYQSEAAALHRKGRSSTVHRLAPLHPGSRVYALQRMALLNPARALPLLLHRISATPGLFIQYSPLKDGRVWLRLLEGWFPTAAAAQQRAATIRRTEQVPVLRKQFAVTGK